MGKSGRPHISGEREPWLSDEVIQTALRTAREHLGLEVAFISEFVDGQRVFRYVDTALAIDGIEVGGGDLLPESYCHYVAAGRLPEFLADPAEHPISASLAATAALGVGTHLSVPIRLQDGRVFGTLCCFALHTETGVEPADLRGLRMLAELMATHFQAREVATLDHRRRHAEIAEVISDPERLAIVYQPLVDLQSGNIIAVEALARFPTLGRGPADVFAQAADVGLTLELELCAVRAALDGLEDLPAPLRVGINVSPSTLVSPQFAAAVEAVPPGRMAVEVTEHDVVNDYRALREARDRFARRGIRLAIDDVGMGFSGLNHILECMPDTIKIDGAVVRDVDHSPARSAVIEALVAFASRMDVLVVAEGIETEPELEALQALGVDAGQGFYLGRPAAPFWRTTQPKAG